MPALIEREEVTSAAPRRHVAIEAVTSESPRPYRAPLATFLALMASARATAAAAGALEPEEAE